MTLNIYNYVLNQPRNNFLEGKLFILEIYFLIPPPHTNKIP